MDLQNLRKSTQIIGGDTGELSWILVESLEGCEQTEHQQKSLLNLTKLSSQSKPGFGLLFVTLPGQSKL
jgi:hypothetical protein